eukprot:278128-Chlamydomonas_euryale.AAC.2
MQRDGHVCPLCRKEAHAPTHACPASAIPLPTQPPFPRALQVPQTGDVARSGRTRPLLRVARWVGGAAAAIATACACGRAPAAANQSRRLCAPALHRLHRAWAQHSSRCKRLRRRSGCSRCVRSQDAVRGGCFSSVAWSRLWGGGQRRLVPQAGSRGADLATRKVWSGGRAPRLAAGEEESRRGRGGRRERDACWG